VTPAPVRPDAAGLTGQASWYGRPHHGRRTASGETYDMHKLTAAHRTLPLGTRVLVTNLENGRTVEVRINDRGPFVVNRVLDLSYAAARRLGALEDGVIPVRLRVLEAEAEDRSD
jgi:rare lipoprotein A